VHSGGAQVGRGFADREYAGGWSDEGKPEPEAAPLPALPPLVGAAVPDSHQGTRPPHKVAAAIAEFITATLPTDPHRLSKPLRYERSGGRVARDGDYRITFRILEDDRVLFIGRIEHRAHVYGRQ